MMKRITVLLLLLIVLTGCRLTTTAPGDFTPEELGIISSSLNSCSNDGSRGGIMRVLTIQDKADSLILRDTSRMLSAKALMSAEYTSLCSLMIATVTHPSQDGVGIAGPQVGLNRRIVAVQRFDKEGEPFEVYGNIRIVETSDSLAYGPEGCLSVPDMRGNVLRSQEIIIEYADMTALAAITDELPESDTIPTRRDTVKGFTAVIFQHETDHLEGILYTDRIK